MLWRASARRLSVHRSSVRPVRSAASSERAPFGALPWERALVRPLRARGATGPDGAAALDAPPSWGVEVAEGRDTRHRWSRALGESTVSRPDPGRRSASRHRTVVFRPAPLHCAGPAVPSSLPTPTARALRSHRSADGAASRGPPGGSERASSGARWPAAAVPAWLNWQSIGFVIRGLRVRVPPLAPPINGARAILLGPPRNRRAPSLTDNEIRRLDETGALRPRAGCVRTDSQIDEAHSSCRSSLGGGFEEPTGRCFRSRLPPMRRASSPTGGSLPEPPFPRAPSAAIPRRRLRNRRPARGGYPSGQRGQTVNLLAQPSQVRILLRPPSLCRSPAAEAGRLNGARHDSYASPGRST